jgi:release factor glutamine methyltransferase
MALAAALHDTGRETGVAAPVELHAADVDRAAVECARRNVVPAGGRVHEGDLYAPLPPGLRGRVSLLLANAPYVPTEAIGLMPPEARLYEPRVALDGGPDGLDVLRRVIAGAGEWLAPGGHLLVETSPRQAPHALDAAGRHGLRPRLARSDELDATVVIASRPAAARPAATRPAATRPGQAGPESTLGPAGCRRQQSSTNQEDG